jgi:hypothetical protein
MALIQLWPKSFGFPDYGSYRCIVCNHVETYEHKERALPSIPSRRRSSDFPED